MTRGGYWPVAPCAGSAEDLKAFAPSARPHTGLCLACPHLPRTSNGGPISPGLPETGEFMPELDYCLSNSGTNTPNNTPNTTD